MISSVSTILSPSTVTTLCAHIGCNATATLSFGWIFIKVCIVLPSFPALYRVLSTLNF